MVELLNSMGRFAKIIGKSRVLSGIALCIFTISCQSGKVSETQENNIAERLEALVWSFSYCDNLLREISEDKLVLTEKLEQRIFDKCQFDQDEKKFFELMMKEFSVFVKTYKKAPDYKELSRLNRIFTSYPIKKDVLIFAFRELQNSFTPFQTMAYLNLIGEGERYMSFYAKLFDMENKWSMLWPKTSIQNVDSFDYLSLQNLYKEYQILRAEIIQKVKDDQFLNTDIFRF